MEEFDKTAVRNDSVEERQEKRSLTLLGTHLVRPGMTLWEWSKDGDLKEARFTEEAVFDKESGKTVVHRRVVVTEGSQYLWALNFANAMRRVMKRVKK